MNQQEGISKARVIVADDDPENAKLAEDSIKLDGHQSRTCSDGEAALHLVQSWSPHVVLLDVNMPKLSGLEVLRKIRANAPASGEYVGVILLTANSSLDQITQGLDSGADDYIVKPYRIDELRARLRACLRLKNLHDSLRRANKRLEEVASRDDLTTWYNMRYMSKRILKEVELAKKQNTPISCIMFDMDYFKQVNDTNDHLFGSFVLCEVAQLTKGLLRGQDIPARYGGDEFIIVLPQTTPSQAIAIAERMRETIKNHMFKSGRYAVKVTASFGISGVERPEEIALLDPRELIRMADAALYDAKNAGRNRVETLSFLKKAGI